VGATDSDLEVVWDLVTLWEECVEAEDQVAVPFEEIRHTLNHTRGVDPKRERDPRQCMVVESI